MVAMEWKDWLQLTPPAFERRLRRRLSRPISHNNFIELYNALITVADGRPREVSAICQAIVPLFRRRGRDREVLLFLELQARSNLSARDVSAAFEALDEMSDEDQSDATRKIVLEIAQAVWSDMDSYGSSIDQRPRVLAAVSRIFSRYAENEQLVRIYLEAANLYSRHGATQSAYRCANDAEQLAHQIESLPLLVEAWQTAAAIAAEENDYKWSASAAEQALSGLKELRRAPSAALLSNLAVARMNLDETEVAIEHFCAALKMLPEGAANRAAVLINFAACLRMHGEPEAAAKQLSFARSALGTEEWPDTRLELELVSARVEKELGRPDRITAHLAAASNHLDDLLAPILRLHHRRGARERYIARIEGLCRSLPQQGPVCDILKPLVSVRCNALGDWLSILDWAAAIAKRPDLPEKERLALQVAVRRLGAFGAPHLYGYREKYDDAWSTSMGGPVWDELSMLAANLGSLGVPPPLSRVALSETIGLCEQRLREGHCLMALTYAGDDPLLWCLIGDQYRRVTIPGVATLAWKLAQLRYASAEIERSVFAAELDGLLENVGPVITPLLDEIAGSGCRSIRFLQDFGDTLPLTALTLEHVGLADRMSSGEFEVRMVPAIYPSVCLEAKHPLSVVAIVDGSDNLLLPRHEGKAFAALAEAATLLTVDSSTEASVSEAVGDADVLLVSTHGQPLTQFTDAFFAQMGSAESRHLISVESLQRDAPDLNLSVVVLNACYSGSGSSRNYQRSFRTSDLVTFPSLFLLNRRAVVAAAAWKTSDTAGFLYASLVGSRLKQGFEPSRGMASSIVNLRRMSKSEALSFLDFVSNDKDRSAARARIAKAPKDGLFSNPYLSGGFAVHGLL
ncbi:hypothetical protein [Mesorhizobium sp.]|uniref:tetratricopeptide repeat protein n=1 Tax=Mesorhizobium sp. TaxID=1871066 RepID=UPI0011F43E72|nr:MAG: CHAT domain-containing protein [Mesorhizobium sp.]TIO36444.1 MAG: CHAT domain-containing protein [Mesorhizobium sp.]